MYRYTLTLKRQELVGKSVLVLYFTIWDLQLVSNISDLYLTPETRVPHRCPNYKNDKRLRSISGNVRTQIGHTKPKRIRVMKSFFIVRGLAIGASLSFCMIKMLRFWFLIGHQHWFLVSCQNTATFEKDKNISSA